MKNVYKFLGIAALALAIVFSFAACNTGGGGGGGGGTNLNLDGNWKDGENWQIKIAGSTATLTKIENTTNYSWKSAVDKGFVKVGDQYLKDIVKTGDLTWTGEILSVNYTGSGATTVATGTTWVSATITMASDGKSIHIEDKDGVTQDWTRM
jgi:predicted secreted protein